MQKVTRYILLLIIHILIVACAPHPTAPPVPPANSYPSPVMAPVTPVSEEAPAYPSLPTYPYPPSGISLLQPYPYPMRETASKEPPPTATAVPLIAADPAGQYTLMLPWNWRPDSLPGRYHGPEGYVQMGYLPEFGYFSRAWQVCNRLANTRLTGWQSLLFSDKVDSCLLKGPQHDNQQPVQVIIKNPLAAPEQRYILLETTAASIADFGNELPFGLHFTRPFDGKTSFRYPGGPLRPEDEAFWEKAPSMPSGMAIFEKSIADDKPGSPAGLLIEIRKGSEYNNVSQRWRSNEPAIETANLTLGKFGYRLEYVPAKYVQKESFSLWRGQEKLQEGIHGFGAVTTSAKLDDFALTLETQDWKQWLLRKDGISPWNREMQTTWILSAPILMDEGLLYPVWENGLVKLLQDGQPIYTYSAAWGAQHPIDGFDKWQSHWLLEVNGALIQDGELLNEKLGFEEMFGWRLLAGKPLVFFRKGPRVGIQYDGQPLPLAYEDVYYGGCCEYGLLNPGGEQYWLRFFGLRQGKWYWVELGFER